MTNGVAHVRVLLHIDQPVEHGKASPSAQPAMKIDVELVQRFLLIGSQMSRTGAEQAAGICPRRTSSAVFSSCAPFRAQPVSGQDAEECRGDRRESCSRSLPDRIPGPARPDQVCPARRFESIYQQRLPAAPAHPRRIPARGSASRKASTPRGVRRSMQSARAEPVQRKIALAISSRRRCAGERRGCGYGRKRKLMPEEQSERKARQEESRVRK